MLNFLKNLKQGDKILFHGKEVLVERHQPEDEDCQLYFAEAWRDYKDLSKGEVMPLYIAHTESLRLSFGGMAKTIELEAIKDRGERAIRRRLRSWPDGKELMSSEYRCDGMLHIVWWWRNLSEDSGF